MVGAPIRAIFTQTKSVESLAWRLLTSEIRRAEGMEAGNCITESLGFVGTTTTTSTGEHPSAQWVRRELAPSGISGAADDRLRVVGVGYIDPAWRIQLRRLPRRTLETAARHTGIPDEACR